MIRQLFTEERKLWGRPSIELASDRVEEMRCGWKQVRPSATYDLRKPAAANKRRKAAATTLHTINSTLSVQLKDDENRSYMSGELDQNYCYMYRGGLSSRACEEGAVYKEPQRGTLSSYSSSPPRRHVQTVTLERSAAHEASVHALAHCRDELSRVLALQLKPELLVEQLIIENRLRTMSLAAFPVLEPSSANSPSPKRGGRAYSQSTPSLGTLPNTHVDYRPPRHKQHKRASRHRTAAVRREAKEPHLQWCNSLSSHRSTWNQMIGGVPTTHWPLPELSHRPSALHRRHSSQPSTKHTTSNPTVTFTNSTTDNNEPSTCYRLPIVSPTLVPSEVSAKTSPGVHTLLYKPDDVSNRHHKSSSLATSSSFYHPSISYSNSQHMK